ncbi:MAG: membrane protein insertase YidC, partial [Micropepsaceae bacterium]
IDERYLFSITDRVENESGAPVVLYPYAQIRRPEIPEVRTTWVVHEGFIGVANDVIQDPSYGDLADGNITERFVSVGGWAGITDKYWMSVLIPDQEEEVSGSFRAYDYNGGTAYETKYEFEPRTIAPGAAQEITHRLFAGPKVVNIVRDYRDELNIPRFDDAIDWGWLFFLTKPIFLSLDFLFRFVGNFGVAILVFTVFVKLLFFPLANTSYRAMGKMKKLQPEMEALRERFKDDKAQLQQGMMALYQKEKVNPLAGCLPIVVQIPVFFSLYKVLFVTIEMRHAPFFGWIRDLSVIEPITIFNLFGLLPFTPPSFLMIGVFPIIMGFTMWIQMSLNPPPADPVQQRIFGFMPWFFMIMLASFPAGLVIYWTWNNILSIAQQAYIMRKSGVPIDLFDKLAKRFRRGQAEENSAQPPD